MVGRGVARWQPITERNQLPFDRHRYEETELTLARAPAPRDSLLRRPAARSC